VSYENTSIIILSQLLNAYMLVRFGTFLFSRDSLTKTTTVNASSTTNTDSIYDEVNTNFPRSVQDDGFGAGLQEK